MIGQYIAEHLPPEVLTAANLCMPNRCVNHGSEEKFNVLNVGKPGAG